tara:strand:+ start:1300 stop:1662 length:363 start_codon:yes stop_codon:yes gene_type:complete
LPLALDAKRFKSAKLLDSGKAVELIQNANGIKLRLGEDDWDKLNTVIALEVDPETVTPTNLALHKKVITSSSVECEPRWPPKSDFGSIRVNDLFFENQKNGRLEIMDGAVSGRKRMNLSG